MGRQIFYRSIRFSSAITVVTLAMLIQWFPETIIFNIRDSFDFTGWFFVYYE